MGESFAADLSGVIECSFVDAIRLTTVFSVDIFLKRGSSLDAEPEPERSLLCTRLLFILNYFTSSASVLNRNSTTGHGWSSTIGTVGDIEDSPQYFSR